MEKIKARDFAYKNGKNMSPRLHRALLSRQVDYIYIDEIEEKDFRIIWQIGIKTWNEFLQLRNNYYGF